MILFLLVSYSKVVFVNVLYVLLYHTIYFYLIYFFRRKCCPHRFIYLRIEECFFLLSEMSFLSHGNYCIEIEVRKVMSVVKITYSFYLFCIIFHIFIFYQGNQER